MLPDGAVYYSLLNTLGYLVAGTVFFLEARRKNYPWQTLTYILLGALIGGLIFSRLGSALFVYHDYYARNPWHILVPKVGGKTLVGGLIGGYLGARIARKWLKFSRPTGDLFAPALALGIAIGRIGCFLNGCCYGRLTSLPWGVDLHGAIRHPTQIYESFFCLGLFFVLWFLRKRERMEGELFNIFLLSYAAFRFFIEFIRGDRVAVTAGLSLAQWIALAAIIVVLVFRRRNGGAGQAAR